MQNSTESAEDRLIARYFRPLASEPGAFGLIDDAAVVTPPPGCDVVLKTDGVIAGVHFFPDDPPQTIGCKALRMNLSDLAAKGAKPIGFLISVALPGAIEEAWIAAFAAGLGDDAARYGCPLLGGDTDHTPGPTSVSITAFGTVPNGTMVRRSTAKIGDCVVVTGTIGDAALGVELRRDRSLAARWRLSDAMGAHLIQRYLLPEPRNVLAEAGRTFEYVIVDLPPLGPIVDVRAAASLFDAFLFIVEWGRTPRAVARNVFASDAAMYEKCFGVIFNKVNLSKVRLYENYGSKYYYYRHYDKYYRKEKD